MKLKDFRNKYTGRIFLIGSGPSLQETPLGLLEDEYTFAVNSVSDIFSETDWRPSFYACVDDGVDRDYYEEVIELGIPCFFPEETTRGSSLIESVSVKNNTMFFKNVDLRDRDDLDISTFQLECSSIESYHNVWSNDITQVVYGYNTIMYQIMQISIYMGFDEIYLVGNDLYDVFNGYPLFPDASDPAKFQSGHQSVLRNGVAFLQYSNQPLKSLCNAVAYKMLKSTSFNRFHLYLSDYIEFLDQDNYFSDSYLSEEIVTPEKNCRHILAHKLANSASKEIGFNIYNATEGGHLEVHPRVDVTNIVKKDKSQSNSTSEADLN